ncbi:endonuclease III [Candidatus Microgenomates bacterium]|nr:endonuclease III [Candidatus Microgenomates bacterium]
MQTDKLFIDTAKAEKAMKIMERLYKVYPKPYVELDFKNPFQLLVATIMAAQCTDKLVNTLTPVLFNKYPTIEAMADAPVADIDALISKVTFHVNKAKNIKESVVLNNAIGKSYGIAIDTHGIRLSHKLGLSDGKTPEKIEADLMSLIPREKWADFGNLLTLHGRHMCTARPHTCENCPLGDLCPEYTNKG